MVTPCPHIVGPAASSSNTQRAVEADGDNGGDGPAAEFSKHQQCVDMIERAFQETVGA